jgi:phage terminase small subunit
MHGGGSPQVKRKAAERLADLIDPDRALREAATLAYSDITKLLDHEGHILPIKDWPANMRGAVSGYETETVRGNLDKGDGAFDPIIKTKLKLWDKPKSLEMLFKHLGLLLERIEHGGRIEIGWKGE